MKKITSLLLAFSTFALFSQISFAAETWKIVPNKNVCMVTDQLFPKAQIPVEQDGKTYFGCCENCKATLATDAKVRSAIDPESKQSVDKATATIAANDEGSVLYFQNKANFEKYVKGLSKKK
ncbi:MAG: hypothetical protein KF799_13890 [Bdellovibrionales bacterium]|nr:hypothetical protein [Bdellovibrionales bacterium]